MIGSFSIIAAALLLVNVFTMLADERQSQLGMLRAVGMTRARLVQSFCVEGAAYALAALVPGIGLGLAVGWVVALVSAQIFRAWSAGGGGLTIEFAVTWTSIVNAAALGLVIALVTIVGASLRISRLNVIAAIRDLPAVPNPRRRRVRTLAATSCAALLALVAVPAVRASNGELTMLLPSLAAALCYPALRRVTTSRAAATVLSGCVLVWVLVAPLVRPHMFDSASMAIYVIEGTLVAFAGVMLISQNQELVVRPLRRLTHHASEAGLSARLALAYPLAKRFRTGATLVMYCLITLVIALLIEITGVIDHSVDANVRAATAGNALRLDVDPSRAAHTFSELRAGPYGASITGITPLTQAPALATDPGHRRPELVHAVVVGVPAGSLQTMALNDRLANLSSDAAAWRLVESDERFVLLDQFFAATGGPNGRYYAPGDTFRVTDPSTGRVATRTIAGILSSALSFYPATGDGGSSYPIVAGSDAVRRFFGAGASASSALVRVRAGVDPVDLATRLQARYLPASLVATPIADNTRRMFAANTAFFRLMQGFLGLGLLVGITGLGVVMVRAVRERRRTIGVLRALGFQARTVRRSFLIESTFVATEGVVLGAVLGVVTTWLMYQKSAAFDGVRNGFPVEWPIIAALCAATLLASTIATVAPARRAAQILPALAVRVSG
jgi:putative ABC transport system permease protein